MEAFTHARVIYARVIVWCLHLLHPIVALAAQPHAYSPHHKVHKYAFLGSHPVRKSGLPVKKWRRLFFIGRLRVGESGQHGSAALRYA